MHGDMNYICDQCDLNCTIALKGLGSRVSYQWHGLLQQKNNENKDPRNRRRRKFILHSDVNYIKPLAYAVVLHSS